MCQRRGCVVIKNGDSVFKAVAGSLSVGHAPGNTGPSCLPNVPGGFRRRRGTAGSGGGALPAAAAGHRRRRWR
eukprot:gene22656-biopygen19266